MNGRPNRDTIPTPREAMALLTPGNLQLAIIRMSTMAHSFYDSGDHSTGDYFAALMCELGGEQDRQRAAAEFLGLEVDDAVAGGHLDGDQMP